MTPRRWITEGDLSRALDRAYRLIQARRRFVAIMAYMAATVVGFLCAYLLRFEFSIPPGQVDNFLVTLPLLVVLRVATSLAFRLSTGRWRFTSTDDVLRLLGATTSGTVLFALLVTLVPALPFVPRSVILMEWILTFGGTAAIWFSYRITYERLRRRSHERGGLSRRVLIVGAGEAGNLLAREILRFPTGYRLMGFVDDDPFKWGSRIHGTEVVGGTMDMGPIAQALLVEEIIIAVPSATPEELRRILAHCEALDVPFKVLPGISEVLEGEVAIGQLRPLEINDLLGREPVSLGLPVLRGAVSGRTVLITGGAGSIGSELARQVAANAPGRLIILDQAESELFFVELELRRAHPRLRLDCVVSDVMDPVALDRVFRDARPHYVFHAAAYKHVPLMETNVREAVRNNVLGTWRVARAAAEHGCGTFVLISTDKAVHPHSVMGATKRVAERIVMACQERYASTSFVAVRFGNVLGSNGSVVPIFRKQIERREPITVTHPEVTRYFMTISEAVQLVLQASTLDQARGRIAMLEMGEPVKILDLARNMIRLSGLREDEDVRIEFIGLRPGEKLHEVLSGVGENTTPTSVERVLIVEDAEGERAPVGMVFDRIDEIEKLVASGSEDQAIRETLLDLVPPTVTVEL